MGQVVQYSVLKLSEKFHQNPITVNKVIDQLIKNLKSMFFHCDIIGDVNIYTHDTQHETNMLKIFYCVEIICAVNIDINSAYHAC